MARQNHHKHHPPRSQCKWLLAGLVTLAGLQQVSSASISDPIRSDRSDPRTADTWQIFETMVALMCALLDCHASEPLIASHLIDASPLVAEGTEQHVARQIDAFQKHGVRESLTDAERAKGRERAQNTLDYLNAHPNLLSTELRSRYASTLAGVVDAL